MVNFIIQLNESNRSFHVRPITCNYKEIFILAQDARSKSKEPLIKETNSQSSSRFSPIQKYPIADERTGNSQRRIVSTS
jgi:hypothetical protein